MLNTIRKSIGEKELWKPIEFIRKKKFLAERLKKKDAASKIFKAST